MCHQTTTSHYLARVSYSSKPCRCHTHLHGQSAATYNYATFHSKLKVQAFFIIFIFYLCLVFLPLHCLGSSVDNKEGSMVGNGGTQYSNPVLLWVLRTFFWMNKKIFYDLARVLKLSNSSALSSLATVVTTSSYLLSTLTLSRTTVWLLYINTSGGTTLSDPLLLL